MKSAFGFLRVSPLALTLYFAVCSGASWAAVSVTDISVTQSGNNLVLSYRLNEPATSVSVVVGSQSYTGTVTKGLNSLTLPSSAAGQSATITATAPAENGTGGAVVLVPFTQDAASTAYTGIAWSKRAGSATRGHLYTTAGFSQTVKKLSSWASDGTKILDKDLTFGGTVTNGSYPFGLAVAANDPNDLVYVANRSARRFYTLSPTDLSLQQTVVYNPAGTTTIGNNYMGMSVTPNNAAGATAPWNVYLGGNRDGTTIHLLYDGVATVSAPTEPTTASSVSTVSSVELEEAVAVDPTNAVLYKAQVHDSGVQPITEDDATSTGTPNAIQKWVSTNQGDTWTLDPTWGTNFRTDIGADSSANALGVALDAGFDATNLAASKVWVSVSGTGVNKVYHANASDGHIITADTIDLTLVTVPSGTQAISAQGSHYLSVSHRGNIALVVGNSAGTNGSYWGVLAPNTSSATTDSLTAVLQPPLGASTSADHPVVGNTGNATVTYTVQVTDPNAQVGTATVTGNLSQIGGPASLALVKATESTDHKTASFSASYLVPTKATLGAFDLPFTTTVGSKSIVTTVNQSIYAAYVPTWATAVDGAVNTSPAANGPVAYIGTDAGSVYAVNAATGAIITSFGSGGKSNVGEAIHGFISQANGKLYVSGTSHVFILNSGTGALLGTSAAIASPSSVLAPAYDFTAVYVGSGDNKIHKLDATTGAQIAVSADLGAPVHDPAIGASVDVSGTSTDIIMAGTDAVSGSGQIVMLKASDLTQAFATILDPKGSVKSRPAYSVVSGTRPHAFAIGGPSGLWGINADDGTLIAESGSTSYWSTDSGENGNPYATPTSVDANIASGNVGDSLVGGFAFASAGNASQGGSLNIVDGETGERVSYGGLPVPLAAPGGGFAQGGGVCYLEGTLADLTTAAAFAYLGSDTVDQRFFALDTLPQDFNYIASADKKHIFDARDTMTFGSAYPAGGFISTPVEANGTIIVGSTGSRVYGFAPLMSVPPNVVSSTPANGATGVDAGATVTLVFSANISTATIDSTTFQMLDQTGAAVDASAALQSDNKTVIITPNNALTANKTYTVVVSAPTVQAFSSSFYTGIPPVVKGDVNGDGVFDAKDVKVALQIAAGLVTASHTAITAGDLYKPGSKTPDGKITLEDALFLSRVLAGKDTLP
jgi:hypothetical protein